MRGTGRVEVAAYGLADAEHLVDKELTRAWRGAAVVVLDVSRAGPEPRLVEEFTVRYRVQGPVTVEQGTTDETRRRAFRAARALLAGTRYAATAWETAVPEYQSTEVPEDGSE